MNITKKQRWIISLSLLISICLLFFFSASLSWGSKVKKVTTSNPSPEKINGEDLKQLEAVLSSVTVNSAPKSKPESQKNSYSLKTTVAVKTPVKKIEMAAVSQTQLNKKSEPLADAPSPPLEEAPETPVSETGSPHYIIQLIAGSELPSILQYMRVHNLKDKARWYRTSLEGHVWYILAYGHYSSRAEANVALNALPRSLRTKGPFIKPLSAIKRV